ncbi:replication factor C subunit 3 [Scaptodrosophila lebanonensis]|uniref:Replication factor C subunit 3 n=1 Tax=Drosophila lebanonensis TaxID=7225 RepID=A0A6J2U6Y2_DROLE|nr:replication factor C subunit 3 [Scaptodrosophila lebanonensis]
MALWVDKYRPRELTKLDYHKEQAEDLRNLCKQTDFPHLMFYGPSGSGKKTRIMCLLREMYGAGVERLRNENMSFTTTSGRKIEVMTVSSNYHLELNPSDAGIYDRTVVIDLIKQVAQTQQIDITGQREFKVIVISEGDELTKDAQHALRRTMEKYVATCRIILSVNSTSRIIPAIRSRCLGVRISAPTEAEITTILQNTCKREGLSLPNELAKRVALKSERNLRRALLMLEASKVQQYPFTAQQEIPQLDWQSFLHETANQILSEQTPAKLEKIRERLYELLAQGVPPNLIFRGLVQQLVCNCDMSLKANTLKFAALYEHRMQNGAKHIFHLEAFVAQFMNIYKQFVSELIMTDDF